jgi:hypothetical protein
LNTLKTTILSATSVLLIAITALTTACSRTPTAKPQSIRLDYAYYNPVSLVLKDKKFLEQDLPPTGSPSNGRRAWEATRH